MTQKSEIFNQNIDNLRNRATILENILKAIDKNVISILNGAVQARWVRQLSDPSTHTRKRIEREGERERLREREREKEREI